MRIDTAVFPETGSITGNVSNIRARLCESGIIQQSAKIPQQVLGDRIHDNRGTLLINAGEKVYGGMVVGYSPAGEDITVNVCKTKHLTNTRASGSDDALRLVPVSKFSLEESLEFLAPDELLEVTPKSLRIRKRILDHALRMKALKGGKA